MQFLLNTEYKTHNARYYDSDISIWLSVDPLAENTPWASPYAYCINNPIRLIDPDGRDWFENEVTGEIIYQKDMRKKDTKALGENWSWMGKNNMFGESPDKLYNDFKGIRNNTEESVSFGFSSEDSKKFMSDRGYKLVDKQMFVYDKSAEEKIPVGPYSNTLITGEIIKIGEKKTYVPKGFEVKGESRNYLQDPIPYLSLSGYSGLINIYRSSLSYGVPKEKTFWDSFFSLTMNLSTDTRHPQYYSAWDKYPSRKNPRIDKYRP